MQKISFWFISLAIIYVLIGMSYGIYISATADFATAPAHGHLNLIGFVMGSIFAFYYHLFPKAIGRLAWAHFGLHQVAVVLMFPGIIMAISGTGEGLAKFSSIIGIVSILVFAAVHWRASSTSTAPSEAMPA